jgi:trimeric autotransporter adhesin
MRLQRLSISGQAMMPALRPCGLVIAVVCSILVAEPQQAWASPATTTTTLAIASAGNAVTTVMSGSVVTLTATVTAGGNPVTPGQINFCDATAKLCTDIHLLGTAQLTGAGTATLKFRPGIGSHSYRAVFLGTANGAPSASADEPLTVTAVTGAGIQPTTTSIASVGSRGTYTLTATVSGNAGIPPTGSVSFVDTTIANTMLGTATLTPATSGVVFLPSDIDFEGPTLVATGDFNGDGIADLIGFSFGRPDILLGNGDGTFKSLGYLAANLNVNGIVVGDFNGDGKLDLAFTMSGGGVLMELGNGDGTFTSGYQSPQTIAANGIAVGDFNGDGKLDLVVGGGTAGSDVTILLGNGDGTFIVGATAIVGANPSSIAVGDLNGDGKLDLAVGNQGGDSVSILLGNGDGTFAAGSTITTTAGPNALAIADFNRDGKLDLAVVDNVTQQFLEFGTVTILLGNGDGTFTAAGPAEGYSGTTVVVGDFNADGIADLGVSGDHDSVLLGNGDGTFTTVASLPGLQLTDSASIAVADFNGDGAADIAGVLFGDDADEISVSFSQPFFATATLNDVMIFPIGGNPKEHGIEASYAGDPTYASSVSSPLFLVTQALISVSLTSVPAIVAGASATSTLTITPYPGFTSTVDLNCGIIASGTAPSCSSPASVTISGTAAVSLPITISTMTQTSLGPYQLTVGFFDGIDQDTSVSIPFTVIGVVPPPAPSFTLAGNSIGIPSPGSTGTSIVTITPTGGFTGTVTLTCAVAGSPTGAVDTPTCSVTAPAAVSGTVPVTATLTVSTTPVSSAVVHDLLRRSSPLEAGGMTALLLFGIPRRRRHWKTVLSLLLFASLATAAIGCATRPTSATTPIMMPVTTPANPGTTPGAYSIIVTGTSGAVAQSTAVTVAVN